MSEEAFLPLPREPLMERRALGAALEDPDSLVTLVQGLRPADFYVSEHRAIYTAMAEAVADGRDLDLGLLAYTLEHSSASHPGVDFASLLGDALNEAVRPSVLGDYIARLRSTSQARQTMDLARNLLVAASEAGGDPNDVARMLAQADESLRNLSAEISDRPWLTMKEVFDRVADGEDGEVLPTGLTDLDRLLLGGLRTKEMCVLAGRPAMGKSTVGMDFARNMSIHSGTPGLFITLEMTAKELLQRTLAAEARVSLTNIRSERLTTAEEAALATAAPRILDAPLYILDMSSPELAELQASVASAVRHLGIRYIVVDYLQLVTNPGIVQREQEIASISRALKQMARRYDLLVIAVAQLNRGPEQRQDKRPQLSDLRDSGQLEQDADVVVMVSRPEYYEPTDRTGEADLIVAKQRNGSSGTVAVAFQGHYSKMANMSSEWDESSSAQA